MSYRVSLGNYNPTTPCGLSGLGCPDCGGTCNKGLGLFDSGVDFSGWGFGEWAVIAIGAYVVGSVVFTTSRGVSGVKQYSAKRRKRQKAAYRKSHAEFRRRAGLAA